MADITSLSDEQLLSMIPDDQLLQMSGGQVQAPDQQSQVLPTQPGEVLPSLFKSSASALGQGLVGAGKGIVNTAAGIGQLGLKANESLANDPIANQTLLGKGAQASNAMVNFMKNIPGLDIKQNLRDAKRIFAPRGTAQKVGFGAEQIGEFLVPTTKVVQAEKGARALIEGAKQIPRFIKPAANVLSRAGIEGVSSASVATLQNGEINDEVKLAGMISAMFPVAGAALKQTARTLGLGARKLGEGIVNTVIKPSIRDVKDGFKIENLAKYNIGGSLKKSLTQVQTILNDQSAKLSQALGSSDQKFNILESVGKLEKLLNNKRTRTWSKLLL